MEHLTHKATSDVVNNPPHYKAGAIECIEAIEACLGNDAFIAYCQGNAMKYIWRWKHKGLDTDLQKAIWYLERIRLTLKKLEEQEVG